MATLGSEIDGTHPAQLSPPKMNEGEDDGP